MSQKHHLNLEAGVAYLVPWKQGGDSLEGAQGASGGVEVVPGDTRALLVGEIEDVFAGMEAEVAGSRPRWLAHPRRGVGCQVLGRGVERELKDGVGSAPVVDVGHKGKPVGGVGLDRMGANRRLQPFDGWTSYRAV